MSLRKIKIINLFVVFGLSFLFHFMYKWLPNPIFSIFLPVNESIWEHMKILTTSILVGSLLDYILLEKNNLLYRNFIFQMSLTSIIAVPIYLLMFIPLYSVFGESMFISISVMFITYVIVEIISYKILKSKEVSIMKYLGIPLVLLMYVIFTYLTYKPIHNYLFYDTKESKYGI